MADSPAQLARNEIYLLPFTSAPESFLYDVSARDKGLCDDESDAKCDGKPDGPVTAGRRCEM